MDSNEQLYKFIERLAIELDKLDESQRASNLRTALYISSVGTEVFMALRMELFQIRDSEVKFSIGLSEQISEAIRYIGWALR